MVVFRHVLTLYATAAPQNGNEGTNSTRHGIDDRQDYHDSQFSQNPLVDKKEWVFATAPDGRYCKKEISHLLFDEFHGY